jgi:DNA repair exonuclease SbcCD ATPase subunit
MRLRSITLHNMGSIRDGQINLGELPPEAVLVGIVGDNGAGKSTTLDLWTDGTVKRGWPRKSKGNVVDVATERDSWFESSVSVGHNDYIVKHLCDCVSRGGEAYAFDGDRLELTTSGKLPEYYEWAKEHLPPLSVLRSSIHSHPSYGSFVSMKPTARKDVILTALGVERLEKLASAARKNADMFGVRADKIRARIDDALRTGGAVEQLTLELTNANSEVENWKGLVRNVEDDLKQLRAANEKYTVELAQYQQLLAARGSIEERYSKATGSLETLVARLVSQRSIIVSQGPLASDISSVERSQRDLDVAQANSKDLVTAKALYDQQMAELKDLRFRRDDASGSIKRIQARMVEPQRIVALAVQIRQAVAAVDTSNARLVTMRERLALANSNKSLVESQRKQLESDRWLHEVRKNQLEVVLEYEPAVRAAVDQLPQWKQDRGNAEREVERIQLEIEQLSKSQIADKDTRIDQLRTGLSGIADSSDLAQCRLLASNTLLADDQSAHDAIEIPEKLAQMRHDLDGDKDELANCQAKAHALELLTAKADEIERARAELVQVQENIEQFRGKIAELETISTGLVSSIEAITADGKQLRQWVDENSALAAQSAVLDKSESALAELDPQLTAARENLAALEQKLSATPEPAQPSAAPDVAALTELLRKAKEKRDTAVADVVSARALLAELEPQGAALQTECDELKRQLDVTPIPQQPLCPESPDAIETEIELVRNSLTAATTEAGKAEQRLHEAQAAAERAGTFKAELAVVEMHQADWTRLGIDLGRKGLQAALVGSAGPELTEMSNDLLRCFGSRWTLLIADGQEGEDRCEIHVLDSHNGHEGTVEDLSDGEKSIVGEAVSLALSILACRHAHFDHPTLIRDESSAALNEPNRAAWMRMLRKAAQIVQADRVLIVSHSKDVVDMCDARYLVANGTIRLMGIDEEYIPASSANESGKAAA